jgi:hypothetical protein
LKYFFSYEVLLKGRYALVLHCSKERDLLTGKLRGFSVPDPTDFKTKKVLIVDDTMTAQNMVI